MIIKRLKTNQYSKPRGVTTYVTPRQVHLPFCLTGLNSRDNCTGEIFIFGTEGRTDTKLRSAHLLELIGRLGRDRDKSGKK